MRALEAHFMEHPRPKQLKNSESVRIKMAKTLFSLKENIPPLYLVWRGWDSGVSMWEKILTGQINLACCLREGQLTSTIARLHEQPLVENDV